MVQPIAKSRCSPVLPHNRIVQRLAGLSIPEDGGFTLIGNAQSGDAIRGKSSSRDRFSSGGELRSPNLFGSCSTHPGRGKI